MWWGYLVSGILEGDCINIDDIDIQLTLANPVTLIPDVRYFFIFISTYIIKFSFYLCSFGFVF
jgi:hypothetical protein